MPHVNKSSSSPLKSQGLRVLIADDHVDTADILAMLVNQEGHAVEVAHTGEDALQLAKSMNADVAILDIGMPGLDGHTVAHRLRQTQQGASMLIVAVTGRSDADDMQRAYVSGFDDYFTKPVEPAKLLGRIAAWQHIRSVTE